MHPTLTNFNCDSEDFKKFKENRTKDNFSEEIEVHMFCTNMLRTTYTQKFKASLPQSYLNLSHLKHLFEGPTKRQFSLLHHCPNVCSGIQVDLGKAQSSNSIRVITHQLTHPNRHPGYGPECVSQEVGLGVRSRNSKPPGSQSLS